MYENHSSRTSLVVQWIRIHLPMQETQVQSLVQEDSTCRRATGTVCHHYWSPSALEPTRHNCWATCDKHWSPLTWSPCSATREATAMRSPYGSMKSMWPLLATTREGPCAAKKTQCSQNLKKKISHPEKRKYSTNGIKLDQDKKIWEIQESSAYCQRVMGIKTGR